MPRSNHVHDPLKETTISALKRVVDPLLDLMFDAGVTVREFNHLVRERAVKGANRRVVKETGRTSKSRIAIMTGLPRSEVARILRSRDPIARVYSGEHPTRRVISAWYENRQFLDAKGDPAVLPIFGGRRSFERLVLRHSGGIPVRAMLDELDQIGAIELLPDQKIRPRHRVPILTGLTSSAIAAVGERGRDLLGTLMKNLRVPGRPLYEATALIDDADVNLVSLIRRELAEQGTSFINGASALLKRSRSKTQRDIDGAPVRQRLGVTVFYFEDDVTEPGEAQVQDEKTHRKNLKRTARSPGRTVVPALKLKSRLRDPDTPAT